MADYKKIQATEISVDQPLTVQLFDKLRQNPLAIAANSNTAETAPQYLQASIEDSTATAESKDRMVAFRKSERSVNSSGISDHTFTLGYTIRRRGVYGLHLQNSVNTGDIDCRIYINDVELTRTAAANFWTLITVERDDVLTLQTIASGSKGHTTRMWLYTNNPIGDMQLMSGFRTSKIILATMPNDNDDNVIELLETGVFVDKDIY
jgi:hypothetical protein